MSRSGTDVLLSTRARRCKMGGAPPLAPAGPMPLRQPPMHPDLLRLTRIAPLTLVMAAALAASPGCGKAREDRTRLAELQAGAQAIENYSAATDRANAAHREVMGAFALANASTNLTDYKAALRTKVLPAMDAFIEKLAAMPAATAELKRIHGGLTEAYRRSRDAIAEFERTLQDPAGLAKFDVIRDQLQRDVRQYGEQLAKYYAVHSRQLRLESGKETGKETGKEAGKEASKEADKLSGPATAANASAAERARATAVKAPATAPEVSAALAATASDGVPNQP